MMHSKLLRTLARTTLVLGGIIVLTSVSIDATDTFRSSQSALSIFAHYATTPVCAGGTASLEIDGVPYCVDQYEAGVGTNCVVRSPASFLDTASNLNDADCTPVSQPAVLPWRQVTVVQAEQLCARAGKRLLSATEWYQAAGGTPDNSNVCSLRSALRATGENQACRSGAELYDMVGNVWEFVSDTVENNTLNGTILPPSGYVAAISTTGVPSETASTASAIYNQDYFWSAASGTLAVLRGGFYSSGDDGGIYGAQATVARDFAGEAVGFRCIQRLK